MSDGKLCDHKGCKEYGIWSPMMVFRAPVEYEPCPPVPMSMAMAICDDHKRASTLADFLTDEGYDYILSGWLKTGKVAFDRARTTLDWQTWERSVAFFADAEKQRGH